MSTMQTSLLFIPFPHSNNTYNDTNAFEQLFQAESSHIIELSKITKMKGAPLSNFRPYIKALSTRRGSQIQAIWSDPFNPSNSIKSRAIETEIAATIWNYIAAIHIKVLQADSSDVQSLKSMRTDFEEINACNAAFEDILSIIHHPFFTPQLAHFMKLYQSYICSYWQLSCVSSSKRNNLIPTSLSRCLEDIKACEKYCSQLNHTASNYMFPAILSIQAYIEGYAHYSQSYISRSNSQYGIALSHLQKGIDIVKSRKNQSAPSALAINTANQFILNALTDSYNELKHENENIYRNSVPDNPPPFTRPCPPPVVVVANPLLCLPNEVIHNNIPQPNTGSNSYSTISNFQNQFPSQSQSYATYGQTSTIPYPTLPDVNYPTIAPTQQSPKPEKKTQSPKRDSGSLNIKEWEIVCALKKELLPRIQKALSNPNKVISDVAKDLYSKYQNASDVDPKIQHSIDNFQSDSAISSDTVNKFIRQASVFYTSLEERLNILERTGK